MNNETKTKVWPLLIIGGAAILLNKLLGHSPKKITKKRIFISFAIEDSRYRDFLVAQSKNDKTPFSFVDMSVKEPWDQKEWKVKCRSKIKSCDGVIVLLSNNTWHSSGARWEVKCAVEEGIPVIGMHVKKNDKSAIPPELKGKKVIIWSWDNLAETIKKM